MQDTFYLSDEFLLRTRLRRQIAPWTFRSRHQDLMPACVRSTRTLPTAHVPQMEGLVVDKGITLGDCRAH